MKIHSPLPHRKGRIEIIPLIDIMFFLLAAFMIVSINKIRINSLKVSLPTDVPATVKETKEDMTSISVDANGQVQVDKTLISTKEMLASTLSELYSKNKDEKILISGDRDARHGDIMALLGKIRQAGFQKVAFAIKPGIVATSSSVLGAPTPPATTGTPAPTTGIPSTGETPPSGAVNPPTITTPPTAPAPAPASAPAPAH